MKKVFEYDLYSIYSRDGKIKVSKYKRAKIVRKRLVHCMGEIHDKSYLEYPVKDDEFFDSPSISEYVFDYTFDVPHDENIKVNDGKKEKIRKLNTEIFYSEVVNEKIHKVNTYAYLSCYQRLIMSYIFQRLWIQKSKNLMWLINLIIAVIATLSTIILIKVTIKSMLIE